MYLMDLSIIKSRMWIIDNILGKILKNKTGDEMKKIILSIFCILFIIPTTTIDAAGNVPTKATREALLEDAVIDLLQPQMYLAVKDYYGTIVGIAFECQRVLEIKKLDHPGSWSFKAKLEGVTYKGAHNRLDIFTVTLKKDESTEYKWVIQDYKVRKFESNDKFECRGPA